MSERLISNQDQPQQMSNPDNLPVHPQIHTRYTKNLVQLTQQWNDRFSRETTHSMPDGKSYWKYYWGKLVVDYNSDFWIQRWNEIIEQVFRDIPEQQKDHIMKVINTYIRWNTDLIKFEQYIRIESLVLAWDAYLRSKMK